MESNYILKLTEDGLQLNKNGKPCICPFQAPRINFMPDGRQVPAYFGCSDACALFDVIKVSKDKYQVSRECCNHNQIINDLKIIK